MATHYCWQGGHRHVLAGLQHSCCKFPISRSLPVCRTAPRRLCSQKECPRNSRTKCAVQRAQSAEPVANASQPQALKWASHVSSKPDVSDALNEAVKRIMKSTGSKDTDFDVAFVFVSSLYDSEVEDAVPLLRKKVPSLKHIFGCSVSGACARH